MLYFIKCFKNTDTCDGTVYSLYKKEQNVKIFTTYF